MGDYPDWTDSVAIIATEIMVAIDLQASYIMMPVDIQAQYVTLNIDIVAQTVGAIDVDIAAASIGNIGIDIKAATIGNITIDIEAQSVGMYLQPDWQVKAGTDKNLQGAADCPDATPTYVLSSQVTAGKTFYICQWGFNILANSGVRALLLYKHNSDYHILSVSGGQVGNAQSFTKPIAVVAGDYIVVSLTQWSGGTVSGVGSVGGYEI
jgi:hypothetical protein